MKKNLMFLTVLLTVTLHADQTVQKVSVPMPRRTKAVTVTVKNANDHTITQSTVISRNDGCSQSQNKSAPQHFSNNAWSWKWRAGLLIGITAATYGAVRILLYYADYWLEHKDHWMNWHKESNVEAMRPQQVVYARALFADIKKRYLQEGYTAANFLDPLVAFSNACDAEIVALDRCATLRSILAKVPLNSIMPAQDEALQIIQSKKERVQFLKQLSVTCLKEYSL